MIPIDEHDPRLLPSPVFQIHTPRKFHPSIVPLALVSPHPEISPSATLDTTPSGTLCRRPHDSPASVPCFILLQPFQGPLRIRETSRLPNNPLRTACIHPSRQAAGHSAKPFGKSRQIEAPSIINRFFRLGMPVIPSVRLHDLPIFNRVQHQRTGCIAVPVNGNHALQPRKLPADNLFFQIIGGAGFRFHG